MEEQFKNIASLIGDPTRATVLWVLLDGKAFTATELSIAANTSPQNMSMHLNKLLKAGLLAAESQGRHRYYRFAEKEVAYAIEALAGLVPAGIQKNIAGDAGNTAIKYCRTCYDHLAGKVGVLITDSLLKQQLLVDKGNKSFEISSKGTKWFMNLGIDIDSLQGERRVLIKPCLDWSERRYHIAGSLGAALLEMMLSSGWIRRTRQSRAIVITGKGQQAIYKHFKVQV
jgi:DNA-binding transcriptional ArsR family regulator